MHQGKMSVGRSVEKNAERRLLPELIVHLCLKLVRAERVRQRNEVAIKLCIISLSSLLSLSLSRRLLKTIEGGVVGF